MGVVFRPSDLSRGRRRILEKGLSDITPNARGEVMRILENWEGEASMDSLTQLVGKEKAKELRDLGEKAKRQRL